MIQLENISKQYIKDSPVIDQFNLKIETGETLILIGLSGCGKTTILKMINRLIEQDSGNILINQKNIKEMNPIHLRRNIGYVIQNMGLFPHLTIEKNISIVPQLKKWPQNEINDKIHDTLKTVRLSEDLLKRYPYELSGGQQQRVGVARAIIADPEIVLMDEPFGALDPITRRELQEEFILLKKKIRKTIIFVTHDIFEAFKIGDRICIMNKGKIIQIDTPLNIANHPTNDFVSQFMGNHVKALRAELEPGTRPS